MVARFWEALPRAQRIWRPVVLLVLVIVSIFAVHVLEPKPLAKLQAIGFDLFQGYAPERDAPTEFAVVRIGERSIQHYGPWPWSRTHLADVVDRIRALGAGAVVIDLILDTPDRYSAPMLERQILRADDIGNRAELRAALAHLPDGDVALARSMADVPTVLATAIGARATAEAGPPPFAIRALDGLRPELPRFAGAISAVPTLREAAVAEGAINLLPEHDMVLRRAPLAFSVDGAVHPALPVAALLAGGKDVAFSHGEGLLVDGALRRSDESGVIWLDFGRSGLIPAFEAAELDEQARDQIAGRVVVLGLQAVGLATDWRLADGRLVSDPEVIATIADALDVGSSLSRSSNVFLLELALTLTGALVIVFVWLKLSPGLAIGVTFLLGALWLSFCLAIRVHEGLLFDAVSPLALWSALAAFSATVRAAALWRARAELVKALEVRSAAAEAAAEAKSRFLREMHHDLRTPLNAILGFSALMTGGVRSMTAERAAGMGEAISAAGKLILALSDRALRAAEIGADETLAEPEDVEVADVLREVERIMRGHGHQSSALTVQLEGTPMSVHVDRTYFIEAVLNLVENAFRHGVGRESIVMRARLADARTVAVDVIDRGPGLSAEVRDAVGTPFIPGRASHDGVRTPGLGLYIVKRFADIHGGRLRLENQTAGGLRATIELERAPEQCTPAELPRLAAAS